MNKPNKLYIHFSQSPWGCKEEITKWHVKERGWSHIGYTYIILNGKMHSGDDYNEDIDGIIEQGLEEYIIPISIKNKNTNSIAICLIGGRNGETRTYFTEAQLNSLIYKVKDVIERHNIDIDRIFGHYEFSEKTCPNFNVEILRKYLKNEISYSKLFNHFVGHNFDGIDLITF